MIAKAKTISYGSISIDYITRMGKAEIVKLNHLPKDVEVEAWWVHMQAHQMRFQYKRSKHRPMKNFMIRIEISPAKEEKVSLLLIGKSLLMTSSRLSMLLTSQIGLVASLLQVPTSPTLNTSSPSIAIVSRASSTCILTAIELTWRET